MKYYIIILFFLLLLFFLRKKTIILQINLVGGLGNRLFQIASGYSIAKKYNFKFVINETYNSHSNNKYNWITDNFEKRNIKDYVLISEQEEFEYNTFNFPKNKNIILNGYFQNEEYFTNYKNDIKKLFKEPIGLQLNFNYTDLIAIHVRLGDFLNYPDKHFINLLNYYIKAITLIKTINKNTRFIVISQDTKETILKFYPLFSNFDFRIGSDEVSDLYFMTRCLGVICSNSTFSWWGGYLNNNINKIIVIPNKILKNSNKILLMKDAYVVDVN